MVSFYFGRFTWSDSDAGMPQYPSMRKLLLTLTLMLGAGLCLAQKRLVLIDQDGSGPGGSNQMSILALLQAPNVEVLGITMVTGDAWRDEETLHTLRMLELTGHGNVPVARGAVFPLVRSEQETRLAETLNGKVAWLGAWGQGQTTLVETERRGCAGDAGASACAWAVLDSAHGGGTADTEGD
jgi:hypothetical protein